MQNNQYNKMMIHKVGEKSLPKRLFNKECTNIQMHKESTPQ